MKSRSLFALNVALLSLAGSLSLSAEASAEEACGDKVCPKGFHCETATAPCPDIACEGPDCRVCEAQVEHFCAPSPCTSDADCAVDMVCHTQTHEECAESPPCGRDPGDDAGDAECAPTPPSDCSTVTVSACVPRWYLPCETAADCGAGFTCEEQLRGGCSGSSGSGTGGSAGDSAGSGGSSGATPTPGAMPAPEPTPDEDGGGSDDFAPPSDDKAPSEGDCFVEPSGEFACVRIETACQVDSDCYPGWTCGANNEGACWASSDGSTGCDPVDPAKICYPPYENLGSGGIGEDSGGPAIPGTGDGGPGADPEAPSRDDVGSEPPKGGGTPANGNADGDSNSDDNEVVTTHGGCSVGTAPASSGLGLGILGLALLGLFGARRRR